MSRTNLNLFLNQTFPYIFIENEAKDFLFLVNEKDWEEIISTTLRNNNHDRLHPIGSYNLYITILFSDSLYEKYSTLLPQTAITKIKGKDEEEICSYRWFSPDVVRHAIELSDLDTHLTSSQREMVSSFLSIYCYTIRIPNEFKSKYKSSLSRLGEWMSYICNNIHSTIEECHGYQKNGNVSTDLLFVILNELRKE